MTQSINSRSSYGTTTGYIPERSRISVAQHVRVPMSCVDEVTRMPVDERPRRRRSQSMQLELEEKNRAEEKMLRRAMQSRNTMAFWPAVFSLLIIFLICAVICLSYVGKLTAIRREIKNSEHEISQLMSENAQLTAELEKATDELRICYTAARRLNMIPAEAAEAIHLAAVDTRPAGNEIRAAETEQDDRFLASQASAYGQ